MRTLNQEPFRPCLGAMCSETIQMVELQPCGKDVRRICTLPTSTYLQCNIGKTSSSTSRQLQLPILVFGHCPCAASYKDQILCKSPLSRNCYHSGAPPRRGTQASPPFLSCHSVHRCISSTQHTCDSFFLFNLLQPFLFGPFPEHS